MEEGLAFSEEFYNSLESARNRFDAGLIYLIHLLQSKSVSEDQKLEKRDEIVGIGDEASAFFSSVKLEDVTRYNKKEFEQRVVKKLSAAAAEIDRYVLDIKKRYSLQIDADDAFSIGDIVKSLSESRIYGDYALTKDKLDNLLVIRRFIIGLYEFAVGKGSGQEKRLDKDFFDLKQKAFLSCLRNSANRNPDVFFLAISIVQKLLLAGKKVSIADSGKDTRSMDEVFIRIGGEDEISVDYDFGGKKVECRISKRAKGDFLAYSIQGSLQMRGEAVDFRIDEDVRVAASGSFEHVAGLDAVKAQYDKAFLAFSEEYNNMKDRLEGHKRKTVIDAALDELFGNP